MDKINDFQKETERMLRDVLVSKGIDAEFAIAGGPREFGVRIAFGGYVCWIYPDGADVGGINTDERFEKMDFNSLSDLRAAFLKCVGGLPLHR